MTIPYVNQILLLIIVSTLGAVLTIAGIEVVKILKEFRRSVKTLNEVLGDTHIITSSVAKPVAGISNFIMGIKSGVEVVNMLLEGKRKGEKND